MVLGLVFCIATLPFKVASIAGEEAKYQVDKQITKRYKKKQAARARHAEAEELEAADNIQSPPSSPSSPSSSSSSHHIIVEPANNLQAPPPYIYGQGNMNMVVEKRR